MTATRVLPMTHVWNGHRCRLEDMKMLRPNGETYVLLTLENGRQVEAPEREVVKVRP